METEMKVNTFEADEVKSLQMDIAAAIVKTREAAGGEIRVEAKNLQEGRYTCELESGKLVIAYKMKGGMHFRSSLHEETQIVLYLPADQVLEHVTLEIGAGEMSMDAVPVSCSKMKVEIGAGKWKAAQLTVSGRLKVEIGAGKAKMKDVTAGRVDIDCGVGSCVYKGRINGDVKVDCGVGNCSFELENKESDFNYDVSCAMGRIRINDNKMRSLAAKKVCKNEKVLGTAVLECGLGSIEWVTDEVGINATK